MMASSTLEPKCESPTLLDLNRTAVRLADRNRVPGQNLISPILPTLKARFGLTDADAAEAILLAGNYSICRRAFG